MLEAALSYQFSPAFSAGVGGRYWHIGTNGKQTSVHFEVSAIGAVLPQAATLSSERWGGFVQASYKFGELRPTRFEGGAYQALTRGAW